MKTFDLELRVTTFGSIITWKVLLEDATNDDNMVKGWVQGDGFRYKKIPAYTIADDSLEVFASSHGILGGRIVCEVLIDGKAREKKVNAEVGKKNFSKESYQI